MKRGLRLSLFAIASLVAVGGLYATFIVRPKLKPVGAVAAGYMARVACACHFVGKRSLASCLTDRETGMEQVRVSIDAGQRRVTAGVPLIASASATYTLGLGCVIDR
jgi:hypothetical protein